MMENQSWIFVMGKHSTEARTAPACSIPHALVYCLCTTLPINTMDGLNLWAVVVAAAAAIVVGMLWYGKVFEKPWMRMTGLTKESMKSMAITPMQATAGGLVTAALSACVFSWLADALLVYSAGDALRMALWAWVGFAVPLSASSWLWEGKPFKLFLLNAGHYLVSWSVISLIVGLWQ